MPLPLLLPLLLVIVMGRMLWKNFTGDPWFQQAKKPQALVWQIWGYASEGEGLLKSKEVGLDLEVVQREYQGGPNCQVSSIFVSKFLLVIHHSFGTKFK